MSTRRFCVVVPYQRYNIGDVIEPTGLLRDDLIRRGWVKEIFEDPQPVASVASVEETIALKPELSDGVPSHRDGSLAGRNKRHKREGV